MYLVFPRAKLRLDLFALPALLLTVWLEGLLPACLLFSAALLHETGHLLALRFFHISVSRVDIRPMGALIVYDDTRLSARQSAWVAFSGAGANLLCLLVTLPLAHCSVYLLFFSLANGFLALLNLLPWEQLDGGKLLFDLLLCRYPADVCENVCKAVSRVTAILLAVLFFAVGLSADFPLWHLLLSAVLLATVFR